MQRVLKPETEALTIISIVLIYIRFSVKHFCIITFLVVATTSGTVVSRGQTYSASCLLIRDHIQLPTGIVYFIEIVLVYIIVLK